MSWQGLNELIELLESSPRHLLMYQDGLPAPVEKYVAFDAARRQRLKTAGMVRLLSEGASLVINHVEQLSASLRALAESFRGFARSSDLGQSLRGLSVSRCVRLTLGSAGYSNSAGVR